MDQKFEKFYDSCRIADSDGNSARFPNVFVLGCTDSRVSFAAQQARALNLVASLEAHDPLLSKKRICVVGGGIAGTTAAAFALSRGHKVTLVEQFGQVLSLQAGSSRWVHPNVYDWPRPLWCQQRTSFPVMNWSAGTVVDVVSQLRKQWDASVEQHSTPVVLNCTVTALERSGHGWILRWANGSVDADVVILAVGYGEESNYPAIQSPPYWIDSDIHQRLRRGGVALVSGCGDGGLIDTIRLCVKDFTHSWLADLGTVLDVDSLTTRLLEIEYNHGSYGSPEALSEEYFRLSISPDITAYFNDKCRSDVSVVLNAKRDNPFDRSSAILHRVIVSILIQQRRVRFVSGAIDPHSIERTQDNKCRVLLGSDALEVDLVVIRHGPHSALQRHLPEIYGLLLPSIETRRRYRLASDLSREILWGQATVSHAGSPATGTSRSKPPGAGAHAGAEPRVEIAAIIAEPPTIPRPVLTGAERRLVTRFARELETVVRDHCISISRSTIEVAREEDGIRLKCILEPGATLTKRLAFDVVASFEGAGMSVLVERDAAEALLVGRGWQTVQPGTLRDELQNVIASAALGKTI